MMFSEKLKMAMRDLNINQAQVVGLIGKSKASVSQYLSGKQVPPEGVQSDIAVSLGLAPDYFEDEKNKALRICLSKGDVVPKLTVEEAARRLQMNHTTVRKGLQQGVFPWGYGIKTSGNRWVYFINARRFAEIEKMEG